MFLNFIFFDLQTTSCDQNTVFFRFLAQIRFKTALKSPQKQSSRPISCTFPPTCTRLKLQSVLTKSVYISLSSDKHLLQLAKHKQKLKLLVINLTPEQNIIFFFFQHASLFSNAEIPNPKHPSEIKKESKSKDS
jgi:hypothetical protein